jgi:hypothetical protein
MKRVFTTGFIVNIIVCVSVWILFFYMITLVWNDHEIASFDPFAVCNLLIIHITTNKLLFLFRFWDLKLVLT